MKTTFRPRSRFSPHKKRLAVVAVLLAVAIIIFVFLQPYILVAASPIWRLKNFASTGLRNTLNLVRSKESLIEENELLKQKLVSFNALADSYRTLESQRDELLARFGRAGVGEGIAASVLVHPPESPYDILVIDAGAAERVEVSSQVSLPEGGALGVVSEVYPHQSKVVLYSGDGIKTPAILERGNVSITLEGQGGGTFEASLPRDVAVVPGDKIILPGIRSELVAVVEEVLLEPTDSVAEVTARGLANINSLRFVLVR